MARKVDYFQWISDLRKNLNTRLVIYGFSFHGLDFELARVYVDPWAGTFMLGCYQKGKSIPYGINAREVFLDENVEFKELNDESKENS